MNFKEQILKTTKQLKKIGIDRREAERRLNYGEFYIDQALSKGGNEKLLNSLSLLLEAIQNGDSDNVDKNNIKSNDSNKNQNSDNGNLSAQAILNLTESNRLLAETNSNVVNASLKSIEKFISVIESFVVNNPVTVDARFADLLEVIADVGTGKKWRSKSEALAELSKLFHAAVKKDEEVGIPHGSGK